MAAGRKTEIDFAEGIKGQYRTNMGSQVVAVRGINFTENGPRQVTPLGEGAFKTTYSFSSHEARYRVVLENGTDAEVPYADVTLRN